MKNLIHKNTNTAIIKWAQEMNSVLTRWNRNDHYLKMCSIPLAIGELQTQTALRFHLTLARMPIIEETSKMQEEMLCPASTGYAILCWLPWEVCPFLNGDEEEVDGGAIEGRWRSEWEEREGKRWSVCKIN